MRELAEHLVSVHAIPYHKMRKLTCESSSYAVNLLCYILQRLLGWSSSYSKCLNSQIRGLCYMKSDHIDGEFLSTWWKDQILFLC